MKIYKFKKIINNTTGLKKYKKRYAKIDDCSIEIEGPCKVYDEDTGELVFGLFDIGIETDTLLKAAKDIKFYGSRRTDGMYSYSRIFGYAPRIGIRRDFCRATAMINEHKQAHATILDYAKVIDNIYKENGGDRYIKHKKQTNKVLPEWKISETLFTSGIINKNNKLPYHFDAGNFKDCYSCMISLKKGCSGGDLMIPEYGLRVKNHDSSILMFDGQSVLHGVSPMKVSDSGYRYTIVYYSLKSMRQCLSLDDEILRIKKKGDQLYKKRALTLKGANDKKEI